MEKIIRNLRKEFSEVGLDVFHVFNTGMYNVFISSNYSGSRVAPLALDTFASEYLPTSIIIGNSKNIWPHFLKHLNENSEWKTRKDPFDDFVVGMIEKTTDRLLGPWTKVGCMEKVSSSAKSYTVHYSHLSYNKQYLSIQSMAHVSGLAMFHPKSHLCVHPEYGPWIGLRAVVTLSPGYQLPAPEKFNITIGEDVDARVDEILSKGSESYADVKWQDFLAIRNLVSECDPNWENWKYYNDQCLYHYTKDRSVLK